MCEIVTEPGSSYSCGRGTDLPSIGYANPTRGKPYLAAILPNEIVAITVRTGGQRVRVPVHETPSTSSSLTRSNWKALD
jgi:hypothetical protein